MAYRYLRVACVSMWALLGAIGCGDGPAPLPTSPTFGDGIEEVRNVILVIADDMGPYLGAYGDDRIETPRMDAIAETGMRFDKAYTTQASCSPSRTSILTGLYPHTSGQLGLASTGFALEERYWSSTLPRLLQEGDVLTGYVGKLHTVPESAYTFDDAELGNEFTRDVESVAGWVRGFLRKAMEERLFLVVSLYDPHVFLHEDGRPGAFPAQVMGLPEDPLEPSANTLLEFQGIDFPEQRERMANYLNAIRRVDIGVGLLVDLLQESGLYEDTAILIVGDHGPPFTRAKGTNYEAGLRVPFIIRWPGAPPATSHALVSTVDIVPTVLDAFGLALPMHLQGESLVPLLMGEAETVRDTLATEFTYHNSGNFFPRRAISDGRWKLIHNLLWDEQRPSQRIDGDPTAQRIAEGLPIPADVSAAFTTAFAPPEYELYDLNRDPFERMNLSDDPSHAPVLEQLQAQLLDWRQASEDPALDRQWLLELATSGPPAAN